MVSEKSKHILDVVFCMFGVVSGLSAGVSFSTLFSNEPAMMWGYYSGCLAFACMVIELLRHNRQLQICCTPSSLWVVSMYAVLSFVTSFILFFVHLSVAIRNREPIAGKSALDHSDFIVAVWTVLTAKFCLKLYLVSKKSRLGMLESVPRPESPNFQAMHRQGPYAESLDSHVTGRPRWRSHNDRRRSSSNPRRSEEPRARPSGSQWRTSDEQDLLSHVSPMPTASQLAAASDSESAGDMDEAANGLTQDL